MNEQRTRPQIRRATAADGESLGRLGALLVQEHHEFDRRRFLAPTSETPAGYAAFLRSQLDNPHASLLVAEQDGRVVGYAYGTIEGTDFMALRGPAAVLHDLIVDAGYRDRGVGRALLEAMLGAFAPLAPRVVLSTAQQNGPAQRFFERVGFRRTMVEMTRELKDQQSR